VANVNSRFA